GGAEAFDGEGRRQRLVEHRVRGGVAVGAELPVAERGRGGRRGQRDQRRAPEEPGGGQGERERQHEEGGEPHWGRAYRSDARKGKESGSHARWVLRFVLYRAGLVAGRAFPRGV